MSATGLTRAALAVVIGTTLVLPQPARAGQGPRQTPAPVADGASSERPGTRAALLPHGSLTRPPGRLAQDVAAHERTRVTALRITGPRVTVVTERVAGRREAVAALQSWQADRATVAVAVDDRVRVAEEDPELPAQWAFPRLRLPLAWARNMGAGATVAVIDTGVDASHPDLVGSLLPGVEVVGDQTTADVTDRHGHGTHVTGTVAAVTDNGLGVAGVAPAASVLPVKALTDTGSGWASDVAEAIVYAADHGADVVNLSLSTPAANGVIAAAVAYARSLDVVVVAAGGNARATGSPTSYPAAFAGVIAVAATDQADKPAAFSNQGDYVDLAAPGVAVRSTWPGGGYRDLSGTSMAAPHVAGIAALLVVELAGHGPVGSDDPVTELLTRTAADLGAPGWDRDFGYGLVDPVAALAAVHDGMPPARPGPPVTPPEPVVPEPPGPTPAPSPQPTRGAAPVLRPAAPRALRVVIGRSGVTVRWHRPAGAAVSRYVVRVGRADRGGVEWRRWHRTAGRTTTPRVGLGRWRVQVAAVNAAGRGVTAQRSFTITRGLLRLLR